jgi:hypothetical protein
MMYNELEKTMIEMLTKQQKKKIIDMGKQLGAVSENDIYYVSLIQASCLLRKIEISLGEKPSNWFAVFEENNEELTK